MNLCKKVLEDVLKQAAIQKVQLSNDEAKLIASKTEEFILEILDYSSELCYNDKRKIVAIDDIKNTIKKKGFKFLYPLFE